MPVPDRPVANTTIDSEWGQAVHDYTFAPSGFRVTGNDTTTSTSITQIAFDTAVDDPGGYVSVASNNATVPADGAGLYLASLLLYSTNGVDTNRTRGFIYVNGTEVRRNIEENQTSGTITVGITTVVDLTADDIITVHAQKVGSGSNLDVKVKDFFMIRLGAEIGA